MNRVAQQLQADIEASSLDHGQLLPAPNELARRYKCTHEEIVAAIGDLIYEGVIERDPIQRATIRRVKSPLWGTITGNHSLTKEAHRHAA
jgi:DNA-binding GntR family transcriptional regulator